MKRSSMQEPGTTPADALALGLAEQVAAWARAAGGDEEVVSTARQAAQALSLATSGGHVCIPLRDIGDPAELRSRLLASEVVGTQASPGAMPLVLDDQDRLYLHRYFDYEQRLARRLVQAAGAPLPVAPALGERLLSLFAPSAPEPAAKPAVPRRQASEGQLELFGSAPAGAAPSVDWQMVAAALALRQRLLVVSGGPGTGKTTTVVNLLACLIEQDPGVRIALAAPTGKAAARMADAIAHGATRLPPEIRERLPSTSSTVHRLLGVRPGSSGFMHDAAHPLPIDVLVVDEASMLDLALATRLLEAVPLEARIILLGDKDQLAAVESGAVFSELSADPGLSASCRSALAELCDLRPEQIEPPVAARPSALQDTTVWFTRNYRFAADSGIGRLAREIRAGHSANALAALSKADESVRWLGRSATRDLDPATVDTLLTGHAPYLETVRRDARDLRAVTAAFGRFRALGAVREGPRGVSALNDLMTRHARERLGSDDLSSPWYVGRPVMVMRNDHALKLYNGDTGIALPDADGQLMVWFPSEDGGFRALAPLRVPPHQTAYAMTVHKSQGSEFPSVLVVLPAQPVPVVTRELVYTAVTRAARTVAISASPTVLTAAIESTRPRNSGLMQRLREATA